MDAYSMVRGGKLNLKKKAGSKSGSVKRKAAPVVTSASPDEIDERRHGGWWAVQRLADVTGNIALEFDDMRYMKSLDNGGFELGPSHSPGESPDPEEMLLVVKAPGTGKLCFKTGFGKYVGLDGSKDCKVTATADAMGKLEMWQVDMEDGQITLSNSFNNCLLAVAPDGSFACSSEKSTSRGNCKIRSCATRKIDPHAHLPKEERGGVQQTEVNYVKSFQAGWVAEKRLKMSSSDKSALVSARKEGTFHEALLDRREKIKSDKFCK